MNPMRRREIILPLHGGKTPRWLFDRMKLLAKSIIEALTIEFGEREVLLRLSDPLWFQSLGCLLGFDWHSSGLTTTTTGAIKEAIKLLGGEFGIFVAGGKGKVSRKTPDEIRRIADKYGLDAEPLIYSSRMSAKVDTVALQDGYSLYHHTFIFTKKGEWAVIQQGMNVEKRLARRYHWYSGDLKSFVVEPHKGIISEGRSRPINLISISVENARKTITELSKETPEKIVREIEKLREIKLPRRHELLISDIKGENLKKVLLITYERKPKDFESLLGIRGVGPKTIRALSLISDIIYGAPPSYNDPFLYSFAHGGKDGTPFPVDRKLFDDSIEILEKAIRDSKLGRREKLEALRRLSSFFSP